MNDIRGHCKSTLHVLSCRWSLPQCFGDTTWPLKSWHALALDCQPNPQVVEHEPHACQANHWGTTPTIIRYSIRYYSIAADLAEKFRFTYIQNIDVYQDSTWHHLVGGNINMVYCSILHSSTWWVGTLIWDNVGFYMAPPGGWEH